MEGLDNSGTQCRKAQEKAVPWEGSREHYKHLPPGPDDQKEGGVNKPGDRKGWGERAV